MNKKTRNLILGIFAVVVIAAAVWLGISYSLETDGYLANQVVDGLSFENASLNIVDGVSTYEVDVVNNTENPYSLKTIEIRFEDPSNNEITTLIGYIGDSLDKDQKKVLTASIDMEIENISNITYTINK